MSTLADPKGEPPNTYFVPDRRNKEELKRVQLQGQMITTGMGGVLFEQPNPVHFQHVLSGDFFRKRSTRQGTSFLPQKRKGMWPGF
jgi:hypothetical protein